MACFGIGEGLIAKGSPRDCGIAGTAKRVPSYGLGCCFGSPLRVAQGVPGDCHRIALGWRGSQSVAKGLPSDCQAIAMGKGMRRDS